MRIWVTVVPIKNLMEVFVDLKKFVSENINLKTNTETALAFNIPISVTVLLIINLIIAIDNVKLAL